MMPPLRALTLLVIALSGTPDLMAQGETCATAIPVTAGTYVAWPHAGNGYEPSACYTYPATHANWYTYTAPFTGHVQIGSCDSQLGLLIDLNTRLSVLTGACGALQCSAWSDEACWGGLYEPFGASFVEMPVVAGVTYYIQWDDFWDESAFEWTLTECAGRGEGTTYIDADDDGQFDGGELSVPVMLEADPGNVLFWSDGPFSRCSAPGSYTLSVPNPPPHHILTPTSRTYSINEVDQVVSGLDFGFWPIPGMHDGSIYGFYNWAWIGQNQNLHFYVRNIGTEPMTPTVTVTLDPLQSYVSSYDEPTSVDGQTIIWELPSMAPGEHRSVGFTQHTSQYAVPYEPVTTSFQLTLAEADVDPTNNHSTYTVPARVGCDPNDKQVDRTNLTPTEVFERQPLLYTIRFQNTGNAPAVNVVVVDTLDQDLDLGTLELVGATHSHVFSLTDGVATWAFPNIMLPDSSTDLAGSQGSFAYRVIPKSNLVLGDEVTNRADIYFDFNEPVLTNTTSTLVALNTGVEGPAAWANGLRVDPTVGQGMLTLRWMMQDLTNARIMIMDGLGREVHAARLGAVMNNTAVPLDLGHVRDGAYEVSLMAEGLIGRARFVIQR